MKNKLLLIVPVLLVTIGILDFILWNNRTVSTITMDINPSIEIHLNKRNKVKKVVALNSDAKDIITSDLKGKALNDSLKVLTNNIIQKGYADGGDVFILVHTNGSIKNQDIEDAIRGNFNDQERNSQIIFIDNITKEDRDFAKKNNISLAKAAYINSIIEENNDIDIKYLFDKSVEDLVETKNTGRYCDVGYNLEGDFCLKEIRREKASGGMVCPEEYFEYEGICYKEVPADELDNMICRDEFTQSGDKCIRKEIRDAEPSKFSCPSGEEKTRAEMGLTGSDAGDANYVVCVDLSHATHPVTPCELPADDPTERTSVGGRCYWHRAPVIEAGCPGKIQVGGMCWDDATNILICAGYRDGKQYSSRNDICENSVKYIDPIIVEYRCPKDFKLKEDKCIREEITNLEHERVCPSGYTMNEMGRCLDYNKTAAKINGLVCDNERAKLRGNECIYYDEKEAKHS